MQSEGEKTMKIYDVLALYPAPEGTPVEQRAIQYSGIAGRDENEAITAAWGRHAAAGLRFKDVEFRVAACKTVLCPTALPEAA
jgi:hypothetical protein